MSGGGAAAGVVAAGAAPRVRQDARRGLERPERVRPERGRRCSGRECRRRLRRAAAGAAVAAAPQSRRSLSHRDRQAGGRYVHSDRSRSSLAGPPLPEQNWTFCTIDQSLESVVRSNVGVRNLTLT